MKKSEFSFKTFNKAGNIVEIDVLSIIDSQNENVYIIYTDHTRDSNNNYNVYISKLVKSDDEYILEEIDSDIYDVLIPELSNEYNKLNNIII
jgi:hypothetical protein